MSVFARVAGPLTCLMIAAGSATAATPAEIDAAIKKGTDALKLRYAAQQGGGVGGVLAGDAGHGIGPTCLAGLAMLEGGVPVTDQALKTATSNIRNAAYTTFKTYQVALCLLYLDRFGDPADVPLIQILAVRLLAGQSGNGGWGYDCGGGLQQADEQRLRAIKAEKQPGAPRLHPEVEKYYQAITASAHPQPTDDNSNTQFAVIAVWLARKHGVPVDNALDNIDKRFMATQNSRTGGWPYNGPLPGSAVGEGPAGSPAMYCAGLIGLSTGLARREERRRKAETPKKDDPPKTEPKKTSDDPFFNPPQKTNPEPKKPAPRALDARDLAIRAGFNALGGIVAESAQAGGGALIAKTDAVLGHHDLYFLWSLERTCVIYGVEKLGGINWYEAGAHSLVITQSKGGTWGSATGYGLEVNTSFAVLFLCRSNLARDLSGKVQNENGTEMRAGSGPGSTDTKPSNPAPGTSPIPGSPVSPGPIIPGASGSEAATLAAELVRATDKDWVKVLNKLKDSKGSAYTEALVTATNRLEGDRLKSAREALAERLTRMTAETLRSMAKSEEAELRRASLLAMAMKDDKNHIPDLIAAILDDEELVVRAAKAGLKSLSGQDFGPAANANSGEKKLAIDAWKNWWSKQKK
jgi:hypothetical protein